MAWTYELLVHGNGGKWSRIGMRFPTKEQADAAGLAKFSAWTLCEEYRVVEVDEPANYEIRDGTFVELPVISKA